MQPRSDETDDNYAKEYRKSVLVYRIIFYVCAAIMLSITVYALAESLREYLASGSVVIGEVLVNTEVPFKGFAKLVTYLMISSVVGWYCVTKIGREKTKNISARNRAILKLIALAIAVVSLYELVYNFVVWNALMTADAISGIIRIDVLNIPYPNPKTPWSLVFATKMFLAAFVISAHAFYLMARDERRAFDRLSE
ncbi:MULTISPECIES: hypothetical protein [Candidatus Nitrosocaldus]|jgi:hypothetical protein|uniref:Uncharacterized protein n=1 Tax=Candidatus Nitrosocaldus cavascurensis TaxID=2058097 RepID=A0A2K5ATA5_9ARCH|nr:MULTISPECIES: hypothetical protein [Candidatus Nitrosocaldus]SPC34861.1 conserved membrane protein of unknown function [Candidatus Nitrosocaldus cavascurensis]